MMMLVVHVIEDLGVEVVHIPGGCTGLCQPIDIRIKKPLKNRVRNYWEGWMMMQGNDTVRFSPPSRETVSGWIVESLKKNSNDHHQKQLALPSKFILPM